MSNEQILIEQIRTGNDDAFSSLVQGLLASAYKTAYLILRSKDLAEDAVQMALEDSFISIMKNKEIRNFKAWFYRLVYSRSIDIYRKNTRVVLSAIDENPEALDKMQSVSAQTEAIQKETYSEMVALIMSMDKEHSVPILLYYYEGLSIKEISLILNEKANTIKTRLSRGRKKLGNLLEKNPKCPVEVKSYGI